MIHDIFRLSKINFLEKILSGIPSGSNSLVTDWAECFVLFDLGPSYVQDYQQTTLAGKELKGLNSGG